MMHKPYSLLPFLSIIIAVLVSCTERIDIELDEGSIRLVVEGSVTTDTMAHTIILTKTTSYFYNEKPPVVTGAAVTINDGKNEITLKETEPGVYRTDSNYYGVEGITYILNIRLNNPVGGYSEYSARSTMSKAVVIDSVDLIFQPDWSEKGFYEVKCYFQDLYTTDYYRILLYRNGILFSDTLDEWFVTDDRFFNGIYVQGTIAFLDQEEDDEKLEPGDILTVEISTIEKGYAEFIQQAQSELFGSNPLFSGPPANIKGNLSNGAIGYFAALASGRKKAYVPLK